MNSFDIQKFNRRFWRRTCPTFLSLIFYSKSCIQNCLNSSIRDTVLVTTATITISNIFFLSQGSSHNNIVKLQSDNIRDKKIIFLVLDHLNLCVYLICIRLPRDIKLKLEFFLRKSILIWKI